jgi:hypothetical protein
LPAEANDGLSALFVSRQCDDTISRMVWQPKGKTPRFICLCLKGVVQRYSSRTIASHPSHDNEISTYDPRLIKKNIGEGWGTAEI